MKVYLDENNICHTEPKEGYIEAEHSYFDNMPTVAIEFHKFIPEHNFIQCTNSVVVDALMKQKLINDNQDNYTEVGKMIKDENSTTENI